MVTVLKDKMPVELIQFAVKNGLTDINNEDDIFELLKDGIKMCVEREKDNE